MPSLIQDYRPDIAVIQFLQYCDSSNWRHRLKTHHWNNPPCFFSFTSPPPSLPSTHTHTQAEWLNPIYISPEMYLREVPFFSILTVKWPPSTLTSTITVTSQLVLLPQSLLPVPTPGPSRPPHHATELSKILLWSYHNPTEKSFKVPQRLYNVQSWAWNSDLIFTWLLLWALRAGFIS